MEKNFKSCVFCFEDISISAKKCRYCLEKQEPDKDIYNLSLLDNFFNFAGKAIMPIAFVIIIFSFKPSIDSLLLKADQAEFAGMKIKFREGLDGFLELSIFETYYLIHSVATKDNEVQLNRKVLEENGRMNDIESLEENGLIERIYRNNSSDLAFKEGLIIRITEKGLAFLKNNNIQF